MEEFEWKILRDFDINKKYVPAALESLNNRLIRLPGFVVPLEDNRGRITEFLLVPNQMSCIHVPPPPRNYIFYVRVRGPRGIDVPWGPMSVTGVLTVGRQSIGDDEFFLRIDATNVEPYRPERK